MSFKFLKHKEKDFLLSLGEALLGYTKEELGDEFLMEADGFIDNLDDYLQKDLRLLIAVFNARLTSFIFTGSFSKFTSKSLEKREKYYLKWAESRIPLLRVGGTAFKAVCGWSRYGTEESWEEMNYPGKTIGREHLTPTLLEGKSAWEESK